MKDNSEESSLLQKKAKEYSKDQPDLVNEPAKPKAKEYSKDQPDRVNEPTKPLNWSNTPIAGNKNLTIESLTTSPISISSAVKDTLMLPVDIAKFAVGGIFDTAKTAVGINGGHATENAKARGSRIAGRIGNIGKTGVKLGLAPAVTAISGLAAGATAISNRISNAYNAKKIKANPELKKTNNPSFNLFKKSFANTAKAVTVAGIGLTGGIALAPAAIASVAPAVAGPAITALSTAMAPAVSAASGLFSTASAAMSTGIAAVKGVASTGMAAVTGAPAATLSAITASTTSMAITGGAAVVGTGLAAKYPKAATALVLTPAVATVGVMVGVVKGIDKAVAEPKRSTGKVAPKVDKNIDVKTPEKQVKTITPALTEEQQAKIRESLTGSSQTSAEKRFLSDIEKATQNSLNDQDKIGKEEQANIDKAIKESLETAHIEQAIKNSIETNARENNQRAMNELKENHLEKSARESNQDITDKSKENLNNMKKKLKFTIEPKEDAKETPKDISPIAPPKNKSNVAPPNHKRSAILLANKMKRGTDVSSTEISSSNVPNGKGQDQGSKYR